MQVNTLLQKGKTNLDSTEARDSEWQWHQLGHMQVCTLLQTDNHASIPPLFLQAGCPSCHPTNSIKALKATWNQNVPKIIRDDTINLFLKTAISILVMSKSNHNSFRVLLYKIASVYFI